MTKWAGKKISFWKRGKQNQGWKRKKKEKKGREKEKEGKKKEKEGKKKEKEGKNKEKEGKKKEKEGKKERKEGKVKEKLVYLYEMTLNKGRLSSPFLTYRLKDREEKSRLIFNAPPPIFLTQKMGNKNLDSFPFVYKKIFFSIFSIKKWGIKI